MCGSAAVWPGHRHHRAHGVVVPRSDRTREPSSDGLCRSRCFSRRRLRDRELGIRNQGSAQSAINEPIKHSARTARSRMADPHVGESCPCCDAPHAPKLGTWDEADPARGVVLYVHPAGQLGIEVSELADMFVEEVSAADAVERLGADLDQGTVRPCSHPPYRCVLGEYQGQPTMVWSHDRSKILLTAVWPDNESRDLLADAWVQAQN